MVIRYRSPSALWAIDRVLVLTGLGFVIASLNVAIGAFATEFRDEFRLARHLLVPATAAVLFLFPLWGVLHPRARTLVDLLPFAALGWLGLGAIAASVLRARRPTSFETLGRVFTPANQPAGAVPVAPGGGAPDDIADVEA